MGGLITRTVAGLLLASGPAAGPSAVLEPEHGMQSTGEFREGEFTHDAGTRRYRLYVPSAGADGRPLVLMLHGCTQDPEDFAAGTRANERAEAMGALVLYPEQPATAHPQKCWSWFTPAHQARGAGEPALLAAMTRHVLDETGADPDRVYVAGISAGGSMAQILAAAYPDLYRALAVHSAPAYAVATDVSDALAALQEGAPDPGALTGRALEAMGPRARPVPTLVIHGVDDEVVRAVNATQALRQWAGVARHAGDEAGPADPTAAGAGRADAVEGADPPGRPDTPDGACPEIAGLTVETSRVDAGAPARRCVYSGAPVPLELWMVEGMGHAWSGGSDAGSFTDGRGPDATARVFDFFLRENAPS